MALRKLGWCALVGLHLCSCGGSDPKSVDMRPGAEVIDGGRSGTGGSSSPPDGLVVSHLRSGNDCTAYYGSAVANTFSPSEPGACPATTAVACARCENAYPNITFTREGIRHVDHFYAQNTEQDCAEWADGHSKADECVIEERGRFVALVDGVNGPSGITPPALVPGTPNDELGRWQMSLHSYEVIAAGVRLDSCTNYYGEGVTEQMRWRADGTPCPDENRVRTRPATFADGVIAEYVIYVE